MSRYFALYNRHLSPADNEPGAFVVRWCWLDSESRKGKQSKSKTTKFIIIIIIKRHEYCTCGNNNQLLNSVTTTLRKTLRFDYNIIVMCHIKNINIEDGFGRFNARRPCT